MSLRVITNAGKLNNTRSLDHFRSYFIILHKHRFGNKRGIEKIILVNKFALYILGEKLGLFWERSLDYPEKQVEIILKYKMDYFGRHDWINLETKLDYIVRQVGTIKGAYKLIRQHLRSRELFHT